MTTFTKYYKEIQKSSDKTRFKLLLYISSIGFVCSLVLSTTAWSTARTYPLSPVLENFVIPTFFQTLLLYFVISGLLFSLFSTRLRQPALAISLSSLLLLVLVDVTRLQPWVLHYSAILILFSAFIPKKYFSTSYVLDAARLTIGGIYFWAGIQKLNARFFTEIFPWVTENLWASFGETGLKIALFTGLLVPFIEAGFALGLLTKRFRTISILASTAMIVLILASLGPWSQNWNSSVWPWNFSIYGMVLILFLGVDFSLSEFILRLKKNLLAWLAISIFWIMPAGNFVGLTDHYLSWSLYSGKVTEATLTGDQIFLESLSPSADEGKLTFQRWTMTDLNLVPYPEERVFTDIFNKLCSKHRDEQLSLTINKYHFGLKSHVYSNIVTECN